MGERWRGTIASMNRDLKLLAGAAGVSALGDFMAAFPLILHVQQTTGSAFAVSALVFALWGPVVLAAGLAGAIVDRFENRRILIVASLGQAGAASSAPSARSCKPPASRTSNTRPTVVHRDALLQASRHLLRAPNGCRTVAARPSTRCRFHAVATYAFSPERPGSRLSATSWRSSR